MFAVVAEFPLGTYQGHVGGGVVDDLVSPARLHAALLNAAASGPRAVVDDEFLAPCEEDLAALAWLEEHPPDGLALPDRVVNGETVPVFREDGLLKAAKGVVSLKRRGKRLSGSVAWSAPIAWTWQNPPAERVRAALAGLCRDVAYLGTVDSPVRLRVGEAEPTHRLTEVTEWPGAGTEVPAPSAGRTTELQEAYREFHGRVPTVRQDAVRSDEKVVNAPVPREQLRSVRYVPTRQRRRDVVWPAPWSTVWCVPIDRDVPDDLRVRAAVAVHRALIRKLDDLRLDVPPCVSGTYPEGTSRPANGMSIQFLPQGRSELHCGPAGTALLLVLVPTGQPEAARLVGRALKALRTVWVSRGMKISVQGEPTKLSAEEFWLPPAAGTRRWWATEPAAVPELRPLRQNWSGVDTVAVSAALLWRDCFDAPGRGEARYRALAEGAVTRGLQVREVQRVLGNAGRFVHKIRPGTVVHPYRAVMRLGELADERAVLAMGQSRHLGCGLLVPHDEVAE